MKKILLQLILLTTILTPVALQTTIVFAQTADPLEYTMLAPLPCVDTDQNCNKETNKTTLEKYLPGVFKLSIGISAVIVICVIIYGGVEYMFAESLTGKANGKDRIQKAFTALIFVIGSWLILNTINPNLLDINLDISPIKIEEPPIVLEALEGAKAAGTGKTLPGYKLTVDQVIEDNNIRADLAKQTSGKVTVNHGPCTDGKTSGCTNLVGMPEASKQGVKDLAKNCNCAVTITGGTEGGHASHGPGEPVLDLSLGNSALNSWIKTQAEKDGQVKTVNNFPAYVIHVSKTENATFVQETGVKGGDHWHVMFGK